MPVNPFPLQKGDRVSAANWNYLRAAYHERSEALGYGADIDEKVMGDRIRDLDAAGEIRSSARHISQPTPGNHTWLDETQFPGTAGITSLTTTTIGSILQLVASVGGAATENDLLQVAGLASGFTTPINQMFGKNWSATDMNEIYQFFKAMKWIGRNILTFPGSWMLETIGSDEDPMQRYTFTITSTGPWVAFLFDEMPNNVTPVVATPQQIGSGSGPGSCTADRRSHFNFAGGENSFCLFEAPLFQYCVT